MLLYLIPRSITLSDRITWGPTVRGPALESDIHSLQILKSKVDPRTKRVNYYNGRGPITDIRMKRKEVTFKTFMIISN